MNLLKTKPGKSIRHRPSAAHLPPATPRALLHPRPSEFLFRAACPAPPRRPRAGRVRARWLRSADKRLSRALSQVHSIFFDNRRLAPLDTHLVAARRAALQTHGVNTKRVALKFCGSGLPRDRAVSIRRDLWAYAARADARAARACARLWASPRARITTLTVRCERAHARAATSLGAAARGLASRSTFLLMTGQGTARAQFTELGAAD